MSDKKDLVVNSLEYYDKNTEKYSKLFSKVKYLSVKKTNNDIDKDTVTFYDSNMHELFHSKYEFLGTYDNDSKVWLWAWAQPLAQKKSNEKGREILNYGLNIDARSNPDRIFLKTKLITSRIRLPDPIQLDTHIAICSYISKSIVVFNYYEYKSHSYEEYYADFHDAEATLLESKDGKKEIVKAMSYNGPIPEKDVFTLYCLILLDYNGHEFTEDYKISG